MLRQEKTPHQATWIRNDVQCLTTKLTLSFALIYTNIAATKMLLAFFVAREKRETKGFDEWHKCAQFFFCCMHFDCYKMRKMHCKNVWCRFDCTHSIHMYAFVTIEFLYKSMSIWLFCWSCLSYREMHSIQSLHSIVGFHPNKKLRSILFCLLNDKIKMHRDMMEWLESRR